MSGSSIRSSGVPARFQLATAPTGRQQQLARAFSTDASGDACEKPFLSIFFSELL
jgi:hypothetical protein